MTRARVVGRCYVCRLPVRFYDAYRVADPAVLGAGGRPILRLVHRGSCEDALRRLYAAGPSSRGGGEPGT